MNPDSLKGAKLRRMYTQGAEEDKAALNVSCGPDMIRKNLFQRTPSKLALNTSKLVDESFDSLNTTTTPKKGINIFQHKRKKSAIITLS